MKIYPNKLDRSVVQNVSLDGCTTVLDWLRRDGLPSGADLASLPLSVFINGSFVLPSKWGAVTVTDADDIEIWREPKGDGLAKIFKPGPLAKLFGLGNPFAPAVPVGNNATAQSGKALAEGNAKGNQVKVNDLIPEIAGHVKRYPDYLLPFRRYFNAPRDQRQEFLLCIGKGEYEIAATKVKVGETPLLSLGDDASFKVYGPGADLSAEPAHIFWYSAPEVGASSSGTAGLELTVTSALTVYATASAFSFNDDTVSVPSSTENFPADWVDGLLINVAASYPYTVEDGTGDGGRDVIRGDIAQLGFAAGDLIEIQGANEGLYVVSQATAETLELNYEGGAAASGLQLGDVTMAIGYRGFRYRILVSGTNQIQLERINSSGETDDAWPGWNSRTTSDAVVRLDSSNLEGGYRGPFPACPENETVNEIEYDVLFPQGLIKYNKNGDPELITATHIFEWRDANVAGPWTVVTKATTAATEDAQGFTYRITLPYAMRPECRIKRTASGGGTSKADTIEWYGLRGKMDSPTSYPGVTVLVAYIRAGDRLAAQTQNLINVECTRKLPILDGQGGWTTEVVATRQISSWIGYITRSIGYPSAALDMAELQRLENIWTARGDTYDKVIDSASTVKAFLNEALRAGFAEFTIERGVLRPVRDEPRGPAFDHMYNPMVMREALSRDFTASTLDDYDGVDVTYTDSTTWAEETVECRLAGDVGQRVYKLSLEGVTDRDRAWRIGMRERRSQVYRRKSYSFSCELDALNSSYLDYVALGDATPGYGQAAAVEDIRQVGQSWVITSSEILDWSAPGRYLAAIRRRDGSASGPYVATRIGDYEFSVEGLDFTPDLAAPGEPPFLQFGPEAVWCYPALITEVAPSGTNACKVTAVNYDPRIYADDDNYAPA